MNFLCEICYESKPKLYGPKNFNKSDNYTFTPEELLEQDCIHEYCQECWSAIKTKNCPTCRRDLTHWLRFLRIFLLKSKSTIGLYHQRHQINSLEHSLLKMILYLP